MTTTTSAVAVLGPAPGGGATDGSTDGATDGATDGVGAFLGRWAERTPDALAHTFIDYLAEPAGGARRCYTWSELDLWTRAVAAVLGQMAGPGDRVAILAPSGPEYVVGFLAALRAGTVAVPLFSPDLFGHADRLESALADCAPQAILTPSDKLPLVVDFLADRGLPQPALLCPDDLAADAAPALAAGFRDVPVAPDDLAYLQYTSGSTRTPAGVRLTHRSLISNARQIAAWHAIVPGRHTAVSWLPLFHDMGLLLGAAASTVLGVHVVLMDPIAFLVDPGRWLRALAEVQAAFTAAPNFAYDFAVKRVRPDDGERLDLSAVACLVNGAEPVLPATLRRFGDAFGRFGLDPAAMSPSYGLAEATLMVSTTGIGRPPTVVTVDTAALQEGRFVPVEADGGPGEADGGPGEGVVPGPASVPERATALVSSGTPIGQQATIVDPVRCRAVPDGRVGEIWVHGPNVGVGYHGRSEESETTFRARLVDPADGLPAGPWLRTGDLGAMHGGELFVTGRLKDLIIVDGRNIYPQDVEAAACVADSAVALNRVAAFAVDGRDADGGQREDVVVVAEQYRGADDVTARLPQIEQAVRQAVSQQQGVALADVVLVLPDSVPRTSSGKIARRATRTAYLAGTLERVAEGTR